MWTIPILIERDIYELNAMLEVIHQDLEELKKEE